MLRCDHLVKNNWYCYLHQLVKRYHLIWICLAQYSIKLSVHKQPSVLNTTYAIQCRVNCPIFSLVNSHKPLYNYMECIVVRLYSSVCLLLMIFMYTYDTLIHIFLHVFKSCVGFVLSNCLNVNKKMHLEYEIHNTAYHWAFTNNQVYSI